MGDSGSREIPTADLDKLTEKLEGGPSNSTAIADGEGS